MKFEPDNHHMDFALRLLDLFLRSRRLYMLQQWAGYTSRICLGEFANDYIATSWIFLPEHLYYDQNRIYFRAVDLLLPELRKGQLTMVINWLYIIFEKNPQFYARLKIDENLPNIDISIEGWKKFYPETPNEQP